MKTKILIIIAITIILFSCNSKREIPENKPEITISEPLLPEKTDTIEYAYKDGGFGGILYLLSNGLFEYHKFKYAHHLDGIYYTYYGSYRKTGHRIRLFPDSLTYWDSFETPEKKHLLYLPDYLGKPEKAPVETEFDIIKWDDYECLLSTKYRLQMPHPVFFYNPHISFVMNENDYTQLAEFLAQHSKDDGWKFLYDYLGNYFLSRRISREHFWDKPKPLEFSKIPAQWRFLFMPAGIETKITGKIEDVAGEVFMRYFEVDGYKKFYQLNKGTDEGIRFGMIFHDKKEYPYKVIGLNKHHCKVVSLSYSAPELSCGDKLIN